MCVYICTGLQKVKMWLFHRNASQREGVVHQHCEFRVTGNTSTDFIPFIQDACQCKVKKTKL